MPKLQPDESDYEFSPPFSFVDATQENRKHPADLKPGAELVKLNMWVGETNHSPTWPWPTYGFATSACGVDLEIGMYKVRLGGAPVSAVGQTSRADVIAWNSPAWYPNGAAFPIPPDEVDYRYTYYNGDYVGIRDFGAVHYYGSNAPANEWTVYYDIVSNVLVAGAIGWGTSSNYVPPQKIVSYTTRYYTGAGWIGAAGVSATSGEGFTCGIQMGFGAVTFDAGGIGKIDLTGNPDMPFSFSKSVWAFVSAGWSTPINGLVYFLDTGGRMFATNGVSATEIDGPFSARMIPEIAGSFPISTVRLVFDNENHRIVTDCGDAGALAMVEYDTGNFQFKADAATLPEIVTGGIQLTKPEYDCLIHYLDLDVDCNQGATIETWVRDAYDSDDDNFVQIETVAAPVAGRQIVRIHANRTVDRSPQFKIIINPNGGEVHAWGIERIAFNNGGLHI